MYSFFVILRSCVRFNVLMFLKHCHKNFFLHKLILGESTWKQVFPAHRTMYFSKLLLNKFFVWNYSLSVPTDIYLLKFSNINSRIKWGISSKLRIETQDVVLVSLFSTLNIFGTLFYWFFWLWTCNYRMEYFFALIWIYLNVSESDLGDISHLRRYYLSQRVPP